MKAAVPDVPGYDPGAPIVFDEKRNRLEFIIEAHVLLDALLHKGMQQNMAGVVCRVARAAHGHLSMTEAVAAELALVDLALFGPTVGHPHVFRFVDDFAGLVAEILNGVLIAEVVRPLNRIKHVELDAVVGIHIF